MRTENPIVRDVMRELLIRVHPEMERSEVAELFLANRISGAPVVDSRGVLLGVVSLADLLRPNTNETELLSTAFTYEALEELMDETGFHIESIPGLIDSCYTRQAQTIHPESTVADAARLMLRNRIHRLIVVNPHEQIPIGIVTSLDLLEVLAEGQFLPKATSSRNKKPVAQSTMDTP